MMDETQFVEELEIDGKVRVYFAPDSIMPEESRVTFIQTLKSGFFKKTVTTYKAVITIKGEVLENENFTATEIHSMTSYIEHNKVKFQKQARELQK